MRVILLWLFLFVLLICFVFKWKALIRRKVQEFDLEEALVVYLAPQLRIVGTTCKIGEDI